MALEAGPSSRDVLTSWPLAPSQTPGTRQAVAEGSRGRASGPAEVLMYLQTQSSLTWCLSWGLSVFNCQVTS